MCIRDRIKEELEKPACINGGECLNTVSGGAGDIKSKSKTQAVQLRDVWFRYEKNGRDIIDVYKRQAVDVDAAVARTPIFVISTEYLKGAYPILKFAKCNLLNLLIK